MLDIVIYLPFVLGCVLANQDCSFKPNSDLPCLEYFVSSGIKQGCLNSNKHFRFAGLMKDMNGEKYLNIYIEEFNITEPVWVRKRDGSCSENCCDKRTRKTRLLLDALLIDAGSQILVDASSCLFLNPCKHGMCHYTKSTGFTCTCSAGYTGPTCETAINPLHTETTMVSLTLARQTIAPTLVHSTTSEQPIVPSTSISYTTNSCEDSPLVKCQDANICSSSLFKLCPVTCRLCSPTTTTTALACVNNPLVKCSSPNICSKSVGSLCPVTCGKCEPITTTTAIPCVNDPLVKCSSPGICLTALASMCPVTCKLCAPHTETTTESVTLARKTVTSIPVHTITSTPHIIPSTSITDTTNSCEDSPFVRCQDANACSSSFSKLCPVTCRLCIKAEKGRLKAVHFDLAPTTTTTALPCVNDPLVKCSSPDVCSSRYRSMCPITCGNCAHITTTTAVPCVNDPLVKCSSLDICSTVFATMCPVTCKLCGHRHTFYSSTRGPATTTGWFKINGK